MSTKSPAFVLAKDWGLHFHTLQSTNCVFPTSLLRIFPPTISNMVISDYYLSLFLSKRSKSSNPRALCEVGMRSWERMWHSSYFEDHQKITYDFWFFIHQTCYLQRYAHLNNQTFDLVQGLIFISYTRKSCFQFNN